MKLIFNTLLAFFILTTFAAAGPLTAAIPLLGTIFSTPLLKGLLYVALSLGASLLQKAMMKKPALDVGGTNLDIQMGDDLPAGFPVGKCATGGKRKFIGVWGNDGNTKNAYLVDVIEFSSLPTTGAPSFWAGDKKLSVLTNEPHSDGRGFPVLEFRKDGKDYMWVKWHLGDQTDADTYLISRSFQGDRQWGSNFIGYGCSYAVFTCRYHEEVFTSGLPEWLIEPKSIALYDPRKDSTVGGSGNQRHSDVSTWEASDNPMVIIYNIVRGLRYNDQWMYGGQGVGVHRWPLSNAFAAMNACDQLVDGETAFRAGCFIDVDLNPLDLIDDLLQGCNGRMAENGGFFKAIVGTQGASVMAFDDNSVIVTKGQSYEPFPSLDETYNGITATYPEPVERWSTKDAPPRYMEDLEVLDGGRRLATEIEFPTVPYHLQIQRLMLTMIKDFRRFRIHQFWLPPMAYTLEPNDIVSYTSAKNGYQDKKFIVTDIEGHSSLCQLVSLKEIDPSDYDWNPDDELDTDFGWVGPITVPPQTVIGWTVAADALIDADGDSRKPAIRISCSPDIDGATHIHVQVKIKALDQMVYDSDAIVYEEPFTWLIDSGIMADVEYMVRAKYVSDLNDNQEWTDWYTVRSLNVRLSEKDIFPTDVSELNKDILDYNKWVGESLRYAREELERIGAWAADQEMGNFRERQVMMNSINLRFASTTASYMNAIEVAVGPDSAIVTRIENLEVTIDQDIANAVSLIQTQIEDLGDTVQANADAITALSATVNNVSANATFRMGVEAAPSGWSSRIAMQVQVGTEGNYIDGGLYIDATTTQSRIVLDADQLILTNGTDTQKPFTFIDGEAVMDAARISVLRTATTGERMEIRNNLLQVFDNNNIERVRLGIWT